MKLKEHSSSMIYLKLKNSNKKNKDQIRKKNKLKGCFENLLGYAHKSRER